MEQNQNTLLNKQQLEAFFLNSNVDINFLKEIIWFLLMILLTIKYPFFSKNPMSSFIVYLYSFFYKLLKQSTRLSTPLYRKFLIPNFFAH